MAHHGRLWAITPPQQLRPPTEPANSLRDTTRSGPAAPLVGHREGVAQQAFAGADRHLQGSGAGAILSGVRAPRSPSPGRLA